MGYFFIQNLASVIKFCIDRQIYRYDIYLTVTQKPIDQTNLMHGDCLFIYFNNQFINFYMVVRFWK